MEKRKVPKESKNSLKSETETDQSAKSVRIASPPEEKVTKSKPSARKKSIKGFRTPKISVSGASVEKIPSLDSDLPEINVPSGTEVKEKAMESPRRSHSSNLEPKPGTRKLEFPDFRKKKKRHSRVPSDEGTLKKGPNSWKILRGSASGVGKEEKSKGRKSEFLTATPSRTSVPEIPKVIEEPDNPEDCPELMTELWDYAWSICADRFCIRNAPLLIALELRDTWLRIMEVEWLDEDDNSYEGRSLLTTLFKPDETIPALEDDSWSRGALVEFQFQLPPQPLPDPLVLRRSVGLHKIILHPNPKTETIDGVFEYKKFSRFPSPPKRRNFPRDVQGNGARI